MQPFQSQSFRDPGPFSRFFKRGQPDVAAAEVETLLATRPLDTLSVRDTSSILQKRYVTGRGAKDVATKLWSKALDAALLDAEIEERELAYLNRLQDVLGLAPHEVRGILQEKGMARLTAEVQAVAGSGRITEAGFARLVRIGKSLGFEVDQVRGIWGRIASDLWGEDLTAALADRRLSPNEEELLRERAAALGMTWGSLGELDEKVERARLLWRIENGELPEIPAPITLQKGEVCHHWTPVEWYEMRTQTTRVNYGGPVARIRIAKGLYYRAGSVSVQRVTRDVLSFIDDGQLFVTNKRVIFDGNRKNTSIRYTAMIGIEPYSDGVGIEKASGRSPVLSLQDGELASVILASALARAG